MTKGEVPSLLGEFSREPATYVKYEGPTTGPITFHLPDFTPLRTALEKLIEDDPRYTYFCEGGFVIIAPKDLLSDERYVLNQEISVSDLKEVTLRQVVDHIQKRLNEAGVSTFVRLGGDVGYDPPDISISAGKRSVRRLLIEAASQSQRSVEVRNTSKGTWLFVTSFSHFKKNER